MVDLWFHYIICIFYLHFSCSFSLSLSNEKLKNEKFDSIRYDICNAI